MRPAKRNRAPGLQTRGIALARLLSKRGLASRKDARALILAGRVRVNDRVVNDPLRPVSPEHARIAIDEVAAPKTTAARRLLAFHKPRGVVTTRRDPEGRPTVFDALGDAGAGLIAVGRLDRASTGLLLFTNDTQLANHLTDPTNRVVRRYVVTVRGRVEPDTARTLEHGIDVPSSHGATVRLAASKVDIRKASNRETHVIVELREGKNREVRRLFEAAGHEVTRLHRVAFGAIELGDLQPGQWRELQDVLAVTP